MAKTNLRAIDPGQGVHLGQRSKPSRGLKLLHAGKYREALPRLVEERDLDPQNAGRYLNLAVCRFAIHQVKEAAADLDKAVALNPDMPEAWCNLGAAAQKLGDWAKARDCFARAYKLDPAYMDAASNYIGALHVFHDFDEMRRVAQLSLALPRDPGDAYALSMLHSNVIFATDADPKADTADQQAERRFWWENHRAPIQYRDWPNSPDPDRRLTIGYLSGDFRHHSAARAFAPLLEDYDRDKFTVICFTTNSAEDGWTRLFKDNTDGWYSLVGLSDEQASQVIRDAEIDILVDLAGHTAGHRLQVMSMKAAPVQVSAIGNLTGTGIPEIDWLFSDPAVIPERERAYFAERIWDLPASLFYVADSDPPEPGPSPSAANGFVTFGSFNRLAKATPEVTDVWREILAGVPNSRISLRDGTLEHEDAQERILRRLGIPRERAVFGWDRHHDDYLKGLQGVDIALDPWPQPGGITSLEAIMMGLPIVSMAGKTPSARVGESIARALPEAVSVARDAAHYVELAVALAEDATKREVLRASLRQSLFDSPFGNREIYVPAVYGAYRAMWHEYAEGRTVPLRRDVKAPSHKRKRIYAT